MNKAVVRYHVGTSGWHYDHWRGVFYPRDLPKDRWLSFYGGFFSTVELNNSFYHLPSEKAFRSWRASSSPSFLFSVKASRFITHIKRLRDVEKPLETFLSRVKVLEHKLGPVLYQLPPSMKRNDQVLERFLDILPRDGQHVLEFRHPSWFHQEVLALLRSYNIAFCVQDMAGCETPVVASADFGYLRFHGTSGKYGGCYSDRELDMWASRIQEMALGLREVYVYFNNDSCGYAVFNARSMRERLER